MPSFSRSTSIYLTAAALNAAVPFVVLPWLARWLQPRDLGTVGTYLALVNVAVVIAGLSVHGVVSVAYFREGPAAASTYVKGALKVLALTAMPLMAALLILGPILEPLTSVPRTWLWSVGLVAACQFVVALGLTVFQCREEAVIYGAIQSGLAIGWGIASVLLIAACGLGWQGRALGQLVSAALLAMLTLVLLRSRGILQAGTSAPIKDLLRFGIPLLPHSLSAAVMAGADRLLLNGMGGPDIAGHYFAAFQMAAILTVAASAVNQAWVPWLYRQLATPTKRSDRAVVRATYGMFAAWLAGAGLLAALANWIVPLMAGPRYAQAVPLLRWLAPAAAFSGMYYFVTNYLFYKEKTGLLSCITMACSAFQLAAMAWAIPRWGAQGAAAAVFVSAVVYWLGVWFAANRIHPMPWLPSRRAPALMTHEP